jgi:hypothetical protein
MLTNLPTFLPPLVLVLHGLGHGGAVIALAWIAARPGGETGAWSAARSWALPRLTARSATLAACAFWGTALVAFVIAGAGLAGVPGTAAVWREAAAGGAIVSLAGIGLFAGTWPVFNTLAAIIVDVAVLVVLLGG